MRQPGRLISLLLSLVLLFPLTGRAAEAADRSARVVKVGFPIQAGTSYLDERGNPAGYLVDYLHQLSLFTGWEIEYVQAEGDLDAQLETLMGMLMDGEIDLMGTMDRNDQLEELFLYPNYSYGMRYTTLAVRRQEPDWLDEDFQDWDGIRVAAYSRNESQISQFTYYAAVNDFAYDLLLCDSSDDMVQAVYDGRADAILQSDVSLPDDFHCIGRFSPTPYYFAVAPGETALLQELNDAMQNLQSSQPSLQTELYDAYFRCTGSFQISDKYRGCVEALGTLRVLFFSGDAPYQYIRDGELTGFAVEYFDGFAESTGLRYEPVVADTVEEAAALIGDGKVDLVACVASNSPLLSLGNMQFTAPYFNSFSVTACTNAAPHEHSEEELEFRMDTERALGEIQSREGCGIRADYYALTYYLRKEAVYEKVAVDWANLKNFSYTVAVTNSSDSVLIKLLNQYAGSVSSDTKQAMLYRYSGDDIVYTPAEWILANWALLAIFLLVIVFLLVVFLVLLRSRRISYQALLAENRLMHLKMYDEMTGAFNETYFRKLLGECCENKEPVALAAFNIRGFRYINDIYGTKQANCLLLSIKRILEEETAEGEFFCRPSADLFYLVLRETPADRLTARMDRLFDEITATGARVLAGHPIQLYGGAVLAADSPSPFCVSPNISYMMTALAHAKKTNAHSVCLFDDSLYRAEQLRYYIETHMHAALEAGEYQLYLQPKINLRTGRLEGAEALVRWLLPDGRLIFPDQFIPLFAENGFCAQLDLYMIEQACRRLRAWIDRGIPPIVISVNQTKSLFLRDDYVSRLLEITKRHGVEPRYLILEVPEGLAFKSIPSLNRTIGELNEAGFRVSMDDFGSGYSSLNTLGKLKINELKLDRAFLMDAVNDPGSSQGVVLASILTLAKRLGITTVAEGIETRESEELARSMACDYGQGYYYSRPVPAAEFEALFLGKDGGPEPDPAQEAPAPDGGAATGQAGEDAV